MKNNVNLSSKHSTWFRSIVHTEERKKPTLFSLHILCMYIMPYHATRNKEKVNFYAGECQTFQKEEKNNFRRAANMISTKKCFHYILYGLVLQPEHIVRCIVRIIFFYVFFLSIFEIKSSLKIYYNDSPTVNMKG